MFHAHNEKLEKKINRRNKTTKSRIYKDVWREGKLQVLGNIENECHQTSGEEEEKRKAYFKRTRQLLKNKLFRRNLIKVINSWAVFFVRNSGCFFKRQRKNLDRWTRDKNADNNAKDVTFKRWHWPSVCVEKKEEEDSLALKIVMMHPYKDLMTILEKDKKGLSPLLNCSSYNISTDRKTTKTRKQKLEEKQLYWYFKKQTGDISH